ncbi:ABC transporter ATP-binding protein [Geomesophilobacter sediminis]|uniref:ABC transporter ATP-binding protein n=1 Tax=Geomesophilobacter sediminis TaxID=2798584 RepID=A0A8J7IZV8_9BACT|nr:ABC transporter ATP-binding protein [Geomesophilobacter sediminis]MBJ6723658.1 ABC transporter ATP-binding protein [Geomesophilobacter sediminis]
MVPVVAKELSKIYREGSLEVTAVASVDLEFQSGELIGLFGPSGSGKTTLLSMLGCMLKPTGGTLELFGQDITSLDERDLPAIRKKYISFIFQGFNLFPPLTVYENVMLVMNLKRIDPMVADQRARELLEAVGLGKRMNFLPRELSGGQRQRVAIARALAADAPLILADEPTGNLDHENGRTVMEMLKTLASEQNCCVVVATHDNRINDLFDRVVCMEDGRMLPEKRKET